MAAPEQGSSGVPQFLTKLWLLVGDNATDSLIRWGEEGNTFIVLDQPQFAREVLPLYFKHNNMASFVRQLNMYGFRKKANIEQGALKSVREDVEFIHPHFRRGQPGQLELIKRKVSGKDDPKVKTEEVNRILTDVKGMKAKQQDINGTLESMKRENQALWSEVMMLRQRHDKQQKIVNRLIQFLLTLVNPVGLKRKQQLAIEAGGSSTSGPSRPPKYSKQISLHGNLEDLVGLQTGSPLSNLDAAGTGAILSDVTDKSNMSTGGVTVSEVTSPLDPKSFIETTHPQQTQAAFAGTTTSANLNTPTVTTSSETPFLQNIGDMSSMPISELLTPMTRTLVPGLADIATMPISEILAPSSQSEASTSTSVAEPIITSPMSTEVPSSLEQSRTSEVDGDGVLSVLDTPNVMPSMELIPKESEEMMGDHQKILKRALSTEEIEQKEQLGSDLNSLQANIDSIQHLLSSTNPTFTVDPDVLLGVFGHGAGGEASLFDLTDPIVGDFNPANISGTEMIEYNPDGSSSLPVGVDVSDEDSLLESLNEDSRALARNKTVEQEEID